MQESRKKARWAGKYRVHLQSVDSTNLYAKHLAMEGAVHGTLVETEAQTGGKGRRGRTWMTDPGTAIAMSMVLRPKLEPFKVSMLTLVAGLAVTEAIRQVAGLDARIKWPNDVVVNEKKTTGILTELGMKDGKVDYVVVGIGINVNVPDFPEDIKEKATSLMLETGHEMDMQMLTDACMDAFEQYYEKFMEHGDMTGLKEAYEQVLVNKDQRVCVLEPGHDYIGIARGIDASGQLLVECEDGTVKEVYAGEVSVRGIYGYV